MPQRIAVELATRQEEEGGSDFEGAFQVTTSIPCEDLESSGCSRENIGKYFKHFFSYFLNLQGEIVSPANF